MRNAASDQHLGSPSQTLTPLSRQHFQGLRRALNKAEESEPAPDTSKRVDPTLNPITRRPGPGRGRPRKSQSGPVDAGAGADSAGSSSATPLDPNMTTAPSTSAGPVHDPALQPHPSQAIDTDPSSLGHPAAMEDEDALAASAAGNDADASGQALHQTGDMNVDDHPSKRQRLESDVMDHETALDDEAVLALAAHNGTGGDYTE